MHQIVLYSLLSSKMLGHLDSDLLSWTEKDKHDKTAHPRAASLGAPLDAGDELQDYYLDEASKRQ